MKWLKNKKQNKIMIKDMNIRQKTEKKYIEKPTRNIAKYFITNVISWKKTFTRDQKINIGYTHKQTKGKMKL